MPAFGPLSARFRDADRPRANDQELALLTSHLQTGAGLVLDVMCGTGRVLVPLAERGVKMHGVDLSPAMLACCEEKLALVQLTAPTFRQDIAHMNLPFRYGCAFIAGDAFSLVTDPSAAAAALARVRAHLVDPGIFVLECVVPPTAHTRLAAPLVEVRTVKLDDGSQIALRSETAWTAEARLSRAQNRYAHRRGAQRLAEEHEAIAATWYEPEEMCELVRAAGFRTVTAKTVSSSPETGETFVVAARL